MGLTTMTELEKHWQDRAQRAVDREEKWESCDDCLRYHPAGYDGACDDRENRLPGMPSEFAH